MPEEAQEAAAAVDDEVVLLCQAIRRISGGGSSVAFGELIRDEAVEQTFEAVMGTLKAAKKRRLVTFEGELLLQGAHDAVEVALTEAGKAAAAGQEQGAAEARSAAEPAEPPAEPEAPREQAEPPAEPEAPKEQAVPLAEAETAEEPAAEEPAAKEPAAEEPAAAAPAAPEEPPAAEAPPPAEAPAVEEPLAPEAPSPAAPPVAEEPPAPKAPSPAAPPVAEDDAERKSWKVDMEYINHRTTDPDRLDARKSATDTADATGPPGVGPIEGVGKEKDESGNWKAVSTSYIDHRTADPNNREVRRGSEMAGVTAGGAVGATVAEKDEDGKWKQVSTSYINHRTQDCDRLEGRKSVKQSAASMEELNPAAAAPSATVKKEGDGKWKVDTSYIGYRTGDPGNLDRKLEASGDATYADPSEKKYAYQELKGVAVRPADVDPKTKELYLSAEEFQAVFQMDADGFSKLPKWKQQNLKKAKDLF